MQDDTGLDGALHLARLGYRIFPGRAVARDDGTTDKIPQPGIRWRNVATSDESMIRSWWTRWPDSIPAISCGESGIVVVDVDPRNGGEWAEPGPEYGTVSGGRHVLYAERRDAVVGNSSGKLAPGVDVRGMGGYVFCWAPSAVTSRPTDLPPVPEPVVIMARDRAVAGQPQVSGPSPAGTPFAPPPREFTEEQASTYIRDNALAPLRAAPRGTRNHALNAAAVVCGHFAGAFWSVEHLSAGLASVAREIGLDEREIGPTVASGMRKGMTQPYAAIGGDGEAAGDGDGTGSSGDGGPVERLLAEMLDTEGLDGIPPLDPLIAEWLALDTLTSVVGKSGGGKSFVTIDMACSVGTGTPWHGFDSTKGEVVYLVAEGARGIRQRVRAWEKRHARRATGVRFLPRPIQATGPEWDVLVEACRRIGPSLVVIDTQARVTVGLEENSAKEMGQFIDRAETLRAATGACVLLVHHTGHQGEEGRGSTAVKGALQTQLSVSKMGDMVTVGCLKQKDGSEPEALELAMTAMEDSVVLMAKGETMEHQRDVFASVIPDSDARFTDSVRNLIGVFMTVFSEGTGGTKAEVRAIYYELAHMRELTPDGKKRAFARSWARLEELGRLARTEGTQRYKLIPIDEKLINS